MESGCIVWFSGNRFPCSNYNVYCNRNKCCRMYRNCNKNNHCESFSDCYSERIEYIGVCGWQYYTYR